MSDEASKFVDAFSRSLTANHFIKLTLSKYKGAVEHLQKVVVRPIDTKKGRRLLFQLQYDTRDIAKNYDSPEAIDEVGKLIRSGFRSAHLFTSRNDLQLTVGKRSSRLSVGRATMQPANSLDHDRVKKTSVDKNAPYLNALGITTESGEIRAAQRDKWRQINKYVEILGSLFEKSALVEAKKLRVVDMGSGKGYLTFAAYDHFSNARGLNVEMIGVEERKDLVDLCNGVASACGYAGLKFAKSDIAGYDAGKLDILIALHACDTATDDAIFKGMAGDAAIIIASPCCHKEIRRQMTPPDILKDVLKHGTMLEREAETITDGIRSMLLERGGYKTKIFEFVPTAHTPKNNMIVATKGSERPDSGIQSRIEALKSFYGIREQRLENLLA